jgi:hypothetical protein
VRAGAKFAVTAVSPLSARVQSAFPEQPPPDHPEKAEPGAGVGISVASLPAQYRAEQAPGQEINPIASLTVPRPATDTESVGWEKAKFAVTLVAEPIGTVQGPVPVQPPPSHPVKRAPPVGVAVSVTGVLAG